MLHNTINKLRLILVYQYPSCEIFKSVHRLSSNTVCSRDAIMHLLIPRLHPILNIKYIHRHTHVRAIL